jgi:hypothetical protein
VKRLLTFILTAAAIGLTACNSSPAETSESSVDPSEQASSSANDPEPDLDPLADVQTFEGLTNGHKGFDELPLIYEQNPPVGGDHLAPPFWQNCGFYDKPVRDEAAVHSLEHGAVWLTYDPDLPTDQVATLRTKVDGHPFVLVSPRADLPTPVVASAWGKQLTLTGADDPGLDAFIEAFENGPQNPEPGAPCSGGLDITADEEPLEA